MTTEDRSLELSPDALRGLIDAATERIVAHIASLPAQPSRDTEGGAALARSLAEPLPETGRPAEELLDLLFDRVDPEELQHRRARLPRLHPGRRAAARRRSPT